MDLPEDIDLEDNVDTEEQSRTEDETLEGTCLFICFVYYDTLS